MKIEDLKTKSEDELKKMLLDTRKDQMNLRFQKTNGTLADTSDVRKKRRLVARIKTLLNAGPADAAKVKTATKKPAAKKAAKPKTKAA
jgi:large subunit ribosomal protein L29